MSNRVLVLGSGPAGLIAAHAATIARCEVLVVAKGEKSPMYGAQYLHQPIPLASQSKDEFLVSYELRGTPGQYRAKVYGPNWDGNVSPEDLLGEHRGWDIRAAYDWLWEVYGDEQIIKRAIAGYDSVDALIKWAKPDQVISTIPANLLCVGRHFFHSDSVKASAAQIFETPDNTVICNGEESPAWYRVSNIRNHTTIEWPGWCSPPVKHASIIKPLKNDCSCWPNILRMGRYGRWEKGVLSHEAFAQTLEACAKVPERLF